MGRTSAKLFSDPVSPLAHTPFSQRIAAGYELLYRLSKEYEKPLSTSAKCPLTASRSASRRSGRDQALLPPDPLQEGPVGPPERRLEAADRAGGGAPVRPPLHAAARYGARLLQDHDVYITDWTDARMVPVEAGEFHLDDYIYYVQDFIRTLGPDVHVISVCQPTVPVLAAISLMASANDPKLPKSMTMMGGPIDARKSPTAVNNLATEKPFSWFENT
jgi:poly(3-hydroxybutyrate) depolymerase